jgi:cytochrome c556
MKKTIVVASLVMATHSVLAEPAKSLKQANHVVELRQSIFHLLGSNMAPLGAMAKGKIPVKAEAVEKYATRIHQLSLMMPDYLRTDTSKFDVKTEALPKIWQESDKFKQAMERLTKTSANLQLAAKSKDENVIKKAIGEVGKSCGGCHDDFKQED